LRLGAAANPLSAATNARRRGRRQRQPGVARNFASISARVSGASGRRAGDPAARAAGAVGQRHLDVADELARIVDRRVQPRT